MQTNSFGGSPITLGEFGIADKAFELNQRAGRAGARGGRRVRRRRPHPLRPRLGRAGDAAAVPRPCRLPGARRRARRCSAPASIAGGVDAILIETCQDPLQIKAAVNGAKRARAEAGKDIPIIVQVTVETTGTLLVGADIAAAATIIHALDVPVIGLNCATGPREMAEHVKWLGENWPG